MTTTITRITFTVRVPGMCAWLERIATLGEARRQLELAARQRPGHRIYREEQGRTVDVTDEVEV
jgi:hypothetical protein